MVWAHTSDNITRDPVRIVEKYISLCPVIRHKTKKFLPEESQKVLTIAVLWGANS